MSIKKASLHNSNARLLLEADLGQLLDRARAISRQVQERVRKLQEQFPSTLNSGETLGPASAEESRAANRQSGSVLMRVWKQGRPHLHVTTRAVGCAPDGMSIVMPNRVQPGSLLELQFVGVEHPPYLLEARYCEARPEGWVAHCQFIKQANN